MLVYLYGIKRDGFAQMSGQRRRSIAGAGTDGRILPLMQTAAAAVIGQNGVYSIVGGCHVVVGGGIVNGVQ